MYQEMLSSGMYDNYNEYMTLNTLARDEYEQELEREEYEKECMQEELNDERKSSADFENEEDYLNL